MLQHRKMLAGLVRPAVGLARSGPRILGVTLAVAVAFLTAQPSQGAKPRNAIVVQNDGGGNMANRVAQVQQLRRSGKPVEIRGNCMSACTMYLGLRNTCVTPGARLGFHGPSSRYYGIALPREEFEYWSRVMANHYPSQLRSWYMREGRNIIVGYHHISGRELIRMGVPRCT